MLLKYCVFILVLSHKVVSCETDIESGMKKNTISTIAKNTTFSKSFREYKNISSLNMKNYSSNNTQKRASYTRRWLEEHNVVTSDGYMLTVFRWTYEYNEPPPTKCPVLLVHGLFQSSDKFLEQIADQSLALNLQDLGYDVWMANFRGNQYGRLHVSLEPETGDKSKFFDYSYEELGIYDVASTVDFILNITTFEKLLYVGHSLGGTAFLVLNSLKPEYNNKFAMAYLMAPLGYQHYFPNDNLKAEIGRLDELYRTLLNEGTVEIFPYTDKNEKFTAEDCLGSKKYKKICEALNIQKWMGLKYLNNDMSSTRGGSLKQLAHLAQNIRSKSFSRWDFGKVENENQYGSYTPPVYNLGLITVPTNILYTLGDEFVSPDDIADMVKDMVNAKSTRVEKTDFKHEDFMFATDVMETVYVGIMAELEENPKDCGKNNENVIDNEDNRNNESFKSSVLRHLLCFSVPFVIAIIAILFLICYRLINIILDKCSVAPFPT